MCDHSLTIATITMLIGLLLGIWLLVTHFIPTLTSTSFKDIFIISRQLYLSRNGTSL